MPRKSDNIIMDTRITEGEPTPLVIEDLESAALYVEQFMDLKVTHTGGYRKYTTHSGYTNPNFPKELRSQGLIMTALVAVDVLTNRAVGGDEEAAGLIKVLMDYTKHAKETAKDAVGADMARKLQKMFPGVKIDGINLDGAPKGKGKNRNKDKGKGATAKTHNSESAPVGEPVGAGANG